MRGGGSVKMSLFHKPYLCQIRLGRLRIFYREVPKLFKWCVLALTCVEVINDSFYRFKFHSREFNSCSKALKYRFFKDQNCYRYLDSFFLLYIPKDLLNFSWIYRWKPAAILGGSEFNLLIFKFKSCLKV